VLAVTQGRIAQILGRSAGKRAERHTELPSCLADEAERKHSDIAFEHVVLNLGVL